ncbi:META domain-containing protein [Hymenobacter sp. H14-R3]|uniref:META domain-containing protein n=1 Tax=Hymenobacter sp. H14-R3 TaxID=3046308 RepID=UPI0024B8941C|nr:META domain-containing protein [Hymenobacter sp. H14-R3]MDJ0366623.1 META domain-containing protein [Hymenobacter sp. H14-R3]
MRFQAFFLPCLLVLGAACQRTDRGNSSPLGSSTSTITTADAPLRETRWVLRQVAGQPVAAVPANGQEPFLRITAAGTAEGQGGCNTFRGGMEPATNDGELKFAPLRSTRMACPSLTIEQQFSQALSATRAYRISGDTLLLYGNAERTGQPLARMEAVYLR